MDGRDEDIWREFKLRCTPTIKRCGSTIELFITVTNVQGRDLIFIGRRFSHEGVFG